MNWGAVEAGGCGMGVSGGCSPLKAWRELEDPLPVWLPHRAGMLVLAVGGNPWFLCARACPQSCSSDLITWRLPFPEMSDPGENGGTTLPFRVWPQTSSTIVSTLLCASCMWIASVHSGRRLHKSANPRTQESLGAVLEAGYHTVQTHLGHCFLISISRLTSFIIINGCIHCMDILKGILQLLSHFLFFFLAILVLLFKQSLGEYLSASLHTYSLSILPLGTMCQVMLKTLRKNGEQNRQDPCSHWVYFLTGQRSEIRKTSNSSEF